MNSGACKYNSYVIAASPIQTSIGCPVVSHPYYGVAYVTGMRSPCQDNVCPSAFEAPMCSDRSMNSGACKYKTQLFCDRSSRRELVSTKDDGLVSSFSFLPRCIMCELSLPKTYVLVLLKLQCAVIAA
jgi:hypothetical protein